MTKFRLTRVLRANGMTQRCFLTSLALLTLILSGCATAPRAAYVAPTITINTIPPGAEISVQGSYVGQSPVAIPMPVARIDMGGYYKAEVGRADYQIQVQAEMAGYKSKEVALGVFHPAQDKIVQPLFSASAVAKTEPGYYTFPPEITIKLSPSEK